MRMPRAWHMPSARPFNSNLYTRRRAHHSLRRRNRHSSLWASNRITRCIQFFRPHAHPRLPSTTATNISSSRCLLLRLRLAFLRTTNRFWKRVCCKRYLKYQPNRRFAYSTMKNRPRTYHRGATLLYSQNKHTLRA